MTNPKHIFCLTNGSIGDFLMTLFFMENIQASQIFSQTKLHVVIPSRNFSFLKSMAHSYPYVRLHRGSAVGAASLARFMFSKNIVITPPTPGTLSSKTKLFGKTLSLSKESILVGFRDQSDQHTLYDILLEYNTKQLYPETIKDIIRAIGGTIFQEKPRLLFQEDTETLTRYSLTKGDYIVLAPQAATSGRSMKPEDVIRLIEEIKSKPSGYKVVLVGSPEDKKVFDTLIKGHEGNVQNLAGVLSFSELASIIFRAQLFMGVDTGTSHIASCLGVKSIVVAHNGTPNWLPYYNPNARILYRVQNCLHKIHEGREHLEECRGDVLRALEYVDVSDVISVMNETLL